MFTDGFLPAIPPLLFLCSLRQHNFRRTDPASQALFVSCTGLVTAQASVGGYRHEQFLSTEDAIYALKINFILRGVDILAYATGKASIGALILRLVGVQNKWQRTVVWVVIILTALLNILNTIFNFVQCNPVSANWDRSGSFKCWPAKAQLDFAYFMSGT